jgi:methyltransferase (TIGR00027 family)
MHEAKPSKTALRVALRRAAHQLHDAHPLVFADALAVRILPRKAQAELARTPSGSRKPFSAGLRAFMVARARVAEDVLRAQAAGGGALQYLVLGAGLDTFAYRNPYAQVRVFEVDHPATQAWKRTCLDAAKIDVPANAALVAVDFERDALAEQMSAAGFRWDVPTVVAWLGVVPYLTQAAFRETLRVVGAMAPGSELVFDYAYPRASLPAVEQWMLDSLSARVAQAGEPFQLFFTEPELREELRAQGLAMVENLGSEALNRRYFANRGDGLMLRGGAGHVCHAKVERLR